MIELALYVRLSHLVDDLLGRAPTGDGRIGPTIESLVDDLEREVALLKARADGRAADGSAERRYPWPTLADAPEFARPLPWSLVTAIHERVTAGRTKYPRGCTVLSLLDEAGEVVHAVNKYQPAERVREELLDVLAVAARLYLGEIDRELVVDGLVQRRQKPVSLACKPHCAMLADAEDVEVVASRQPSTNGEAAVAKFTGVWDHEGQGHVGACLGRDTDDRILSPPGRCPGCDLLRKRQAWGHGAARPPRPACVPLPFPHERRCATHEGRPLYPMTNRCAEGAGGEHVPHR